MNDPRREQVIALFKEIAGAFPHLQCQLETKHPHVDVNMDFPQQPGLKFAVNINLQGDELHISAGCFWLEWFPCSKKEIVDEFVQAVKGLLSGKLRIVEYYRGDKSMKAELQEPREGKWNTIGTSSRLHVPFLKATHQKVLINDAQ